MERPIDADMNIQSGTGFPSFNLANLFKSLNVRSAQITMAQVTITADASQPAAQPTTTTPATTPTTSVTPTTAVTTPTETTPAPAPTPTPAPAPTRPSDSTDISSEARERCRCESGDNKGVREQRGYSPERLLRLADKFSSRAERLEAKAAKLQENGGDQERIDRLTARAERYWKLAEKFASMVPGGEDEAPAPTPTPAPTPAPVPASKPAADNATLAPAVNAQPLDLVA